MVKSDLGRKWKGCVTTQAWHSPPSGKYWLGTWMGWGCRQGVGFGDWRKEWGRVQCVWELWSDKEPIASPVNSPQASRVCMATLTTWGREPWREPWHGKFGEVPCGQCELAWNLFSQPGSCPELPAFVILSESWIPPPPPPHPCWVRLKPGNQHNLQPLPTPILCFAQVRKTVGLKEMGWNDFFSWGANRRRSVWCFFVWNFFVCFLNFPHI